MYAEAEMIVDERPVNSKIKIDLRGPDGNAFVLLGITWQILRAIGYTESAVDEVLREMKSGDYENLLQVMDREVGEYVVMYR